MRYASNPDSFDITFLGGINGSKLTHQSGHRFKLFPYNTNNNRVTDLGSLIGRYISLIEEKEPKPISPDTLISQLKNDPDLSIDLGMEDAFEQMVRYMFFDREDRIRPINLKMLGQIPCTENCEKKLAEYLVDVLGDVETLKAIVLDAAEKVNEQSNVLESFAASKLEATIIPRKTEDRYHRITNALCRHYEADFQYILGARNRTRDYLIPLVEFYYFSYTAQAIMQLNRFLDGEREQCIPIFFCLDWEKTSQNRRCFSEGWGLLQESIKRIFAHAVVLEILNQTDDPAVSVDYIQLNELTSNAPEEDHRIAEEIKKLTDRYRMAIRDCPEMAELSRDSHPVGETAAEVKYLFDSVKTQFENTWRERPYNSYASKFEEYAKRYLKRRGRSGMMLNISEETLILLTKICIKDQEKMRLNDVFAAFEARGVFLDSHSKAEVMRYYEKLNLIEKKSDSGDAQYVKRIL